MSTDDNGKPRLRLAVENDPKVAERERAKRDIVWPLRDLASNIIRVSRGAGKPYDIAQQCQSVIESFIAYRESCGTWPPSWDIQEALSIRNERLDRLADEHWERESAVESIIRGALQVSASRLAGQNTQERRGASELHDGIRALDLAREEMRRRRLEQEEAARRERKNIAAPRQPKRKNAASTEDSEAGS